MPTIMDVLITYFFMRNAKAISFLLGSALILTGAGCSFSTDSAPVAPAPAPAPAAAVVPAPIFAVGDSVLGNWHGGSRWWEAKVTAVAGNQVTIKYDSDNSSETLSASAVAHYPSAAVVAKVGDMAVAKWSDGKYYGGTVTAINGTAVTMKWSDGSTPSGATLSEVSVAGK